MVVYQLSLDSLSSSASDRPDYEAHKSQVNDYDFELLSPFGLKFQFLSCFFE